MPAPKSRKKSPAAPAASSMGKAIPAAVAVSAAVAGAARRRASRRRAEAASAKTVSAPTSVTRASAKSSKAPSTARGRGRGAKSGSASWVKAARGLAKNASPRQVRRDARKVLDKGVGKADQLLESAMKWAVKLAIRAKALYDMLQAWWHGKFDFPTGTLQAIVVALLYFVSPLDLIPDVLPLFGLVDDAAVFAFVFHRIRQDLETYAQKTGKSLSDIGL